MTLALATLPSFSSDIISEAIDFSMRAKRLKARITPGTSQSLPIGGGLSGCKQCDQNNLIDHRFRWDDRPCT